MAPLNYQQRHDRHLEDGLATHGDEKLVLKEELAGTPTCPLPSSSKPPARKMNLRRLTVCLGAGFLVGCGLSTASRTKSHRALCSQEVHAFNEHEMQALVEQTKDDTSALSEMLRCASPETFHKLVSVYFPDRSKPEEDGSRSAAIGKDETWLLTAWDKLVKRQEDGAGNPATPSDSATDAAGDAGSGTATVTGDDSVSSEPSVTEPGSDTEPTTSEIPANPSSSDPVAEPSSDPVSEPPQNTETEIDEPTSVQQPPSSSTSQELPESTSEEPATSEEPSTSEEVAPETTSASSEEVPSTTEQVPSTTSTTTQERPESSTSSEGMSSSEELHLSSTLSTSSSFPSSSAPVPSSTSSSFDVSTSTLPKETSTEHGTFSPKKALVFPLASFSSARSTFETLC